jgi:hypothetical protein
VHLTLDDLHAAAASFAIDSATDSALGAIFASGGAVLSVPIDIPSFTVAASATLRVTDDAPSEIPLALFGSSAAIAHVDAIAIAPLPASVAGARDIDPSLLTWGASGSSYGAARASAFGAGASWIRESSMREPLFDGVPSASAPALVDRFAPTCAGTMRDAASASGAVGRACPAGGAARVPGGSGCAPISGAIDPSSFACAGSDDLALALSGSTPRSVVVSRLSGVVASGAPGQGNALATGSTRGLLVQAGSYASCAEPPPVSGGGSSSSSSSSSGGYSGSSSSGAGAAVVVAPVAAGGDDSCGSSSADDGSSSDGCGSSSSESTADSSSGSSDGCSSSKQSDDGQDDSKKSDDSCGSSNLTAKKTSMRHKRSPVSRAALLAIALILPLRRRFRRAG